MNIRTNQILAGMGFLLVFVFAAPPAQANLIIDPGFENNSLLNYTTVLGNFAAYQGQWGTENGTTTAAEGGVTPAEGSKMLRMDNDGLTQTQTFQVIDVTSYASLIDSGSAEFNLSALFNTPSGVLGGGIVNLMFFTNAVWSIPPSNGSLNSFLTLDGNDGTWQTISAQGVIPVNTHWLVAEVAYTNSSIGSNPGYVDAANLTIISVPEPATLFLLAYGGLLMMQRHRKTR